MNWLLAMRFWVGLAMGAWVASIAPGIAATTVGTLAVSATVAYPCTVIAAPHPGGAVCQPGFGPFTAVAPHAIRTLRRDAETGITMLMVEF